MSTLFLWGVIRIRRGNTQAVEAIRKLRIEDIAGLVVQGKEGLSRAYGLRLDLTNRDQAAEMLDGLFADSLKLKNTFERAGFYWYFVLPVGALVGEFIALHAKGVWKQGSEGPVMDIPVADGVATCYPFEKVLKQLNQGEKRDLSAFLLASTELASSVSRTQ